MNTKKIIGILAVIVVALLLFVVIQKMPLSLGQYNRVPKAPVEETYRERKTIEGVYTCLPHRDVKPGQPQTLECALGIKTDDGTYYAISMMAMSSTPDAVSTGDRVMAEGLVSQIVENDPLYRYDATYLMLVTYSFKKVTQGSASVTTTTSAPIVTVPSAPVFTWKFEYNENALDASGLPQTKVSLEVRYANGKTESKPVDTVSGSCNALPDNQKDSVVNSVDAQCYAAGLGYKFKITKGTNAYLVQRQEFEEGSPEYNPPVQKYVVIADFPLAI